MPASNERNVAMKKIKPRKVTGMLKEGKPLKITYKITDISRDNNGIPKLRGIGQCTINTYNE